MSGHRPCWGWNGAAAVLAGFALATPRAIAQPETELRAEIQAAANVSASAAALPFHLGAREGTLRFESPVGLCRAFRLSLPPGGYVGQVCRAAGFPLWRVESFIRFAPQKDAFIHLQPEVGEERAFIPPNPSPPGSKLPKASDVFPPPHQAPFITRPSHPQSDPTSAAEQGVVMPAAPAQPLVPVKRHRKSLPLDDNASVQPHFSPAPYNSTGQMHEPLAPSTQGPTAEEPSGGQGGTPHAAAPFPKGSPAPQPQPGPVSAQSDAMRALFQSMPTRYNRPPTISFDHDTTVGFVVEGQGSGSSAAMLGDLPGDQVAGAEALTPDVVVRLKGPDDEVVIAARTPDQQHVTTLNNTYWFWDVRAKKPGATTLTLTVEPLDTKGRSLTPQLVYVNRIKVVIEPVSRVTYWIGVINPLYKFLGLGTPVALIAGAWAFWRRRHAKSLA